MLFCINTVMVFRLNIKTVLNIPLLIQQYIHYGRNKLIIRNQRYTLMKFRIQLSNKSDVLHIRINSKENSFKLLYIFLLQIFCRPSDCFCFQQYPYSNNISQLFG